MAGAATGLVSPDAHPLPGVQDLANPGMGPIRESLATPGDTAGEEGQSDPGNLPEEDLDPRP